MEVENNMRKFLMKSPAAALALSFAALSLGPAFGQSQPPTVQDRFLFNCEGSETIDANGARVATIRIWWDNSKQRDPETGELLWRDKLYVQANMIRPTNPRVQDLPTDRNEYTITATAFGRTKLIDPQGSFRIGRSTGGEMTYTVYPLQAPAPRKPGCYPTGWNPTARGF
ncbi:MAG TPA: hypothetical protein DHW63_03130 [Hyphomonadaceae bacterium]|nr:hypothetical protein [Hyphomonadaceae bacterium]